MQPAITHDQNTLIDIFNRSVTPHNIYSPDNVIYVDTNDQDIVNFISNDMVHRGIETHQFVKHRNYTV